MNSCLLASNCSRICDLTSRRFLRRMVPNPGKPPILPPSKQSLYRVVNGDWAEPAHVEELLWRRHVYNNAMLAMRERFRDEIQQREIFLGIGELKSKEMEELDEHIRLNDERNARAAEQRAEREKIQMEEFKAETIAEIDEILRIQDEDVERRSEEVKKYIEESKNFVTRENLRARIEEALEKPVVFDFAIDLNGKRLYAKEPVKYLEGQVSRQRGRLYDRSHNQNLQKNA